MFEKMAWLLAKGAISSPMCSQANDDKIALEAKPLYITLQVPFHSSVFKQEKCVLGEKPCRSLWQCI